MNTIAASAAPTHTLRARSAAYSLLALVLGSRTQALVDEPTVSALRTALDATGDPAAARLADLEVRSLPDPAQLQGRWVRWFDLGRVAPYEGSNVATTVGGITPRLADVAGFYRAFGMAVTGDRPDHVVAQLEFLALAVLAEAEALERGDAERAQIAADATRSFLRDHIGTWIDAWTARVGAIDELAPWFQYAAAAADLVRSEGAHRNVIPLRAAAILSADAGLAANEEAAVSCDDDDLLAAPWSQT